MPADVLMKTLNLGHKAILKLSGGKIGWTAGKMPVLELTTIGRKSGEKRSVMLTSPVQRGGSIVVVASKGGDDRHPAWYLNLQANPAVEVKWRGGDAGPYTARIAQDQEHDALWDEIVSTYSNYAGYQTKTDRKIPLVFLDPS